MAELLGSPKDKPPSACVPEEHRCDCLVWGLFAWFVLVPMWLTWTPFVFESFEQLAHLRANLMDVAANLLLLAPLGMAAAYLVPRRPVLWSLLAALVLSSSIEVGQVFLPSRVASPLDILLNTAGAGLGAFAAIALGPVRHRQVLWAWAVLVYVVILAQVGYTERTLRGGFSMAGWDPAYGIAAGDEIGAYRRYKGEVKGAYICAGREDAVCVGPGADREAREALVRLAERTQRVEVGATVHSTSDNQVGPTRIVTFSQGSLERNLMIGQDGTTLVIRVRRPLTGPNGSDLELHVPEAIIGGRSVNLRVVVDGRTVRTEITEGGKIRSHLHTFDALSGSVLFGSLKTITPAQSQRTRWATLALILYPLIALVISVLAQTSRPSTPGGR